MKTLDSGLSQSSQQKGGIWFLKLLYLRHISLSFGKKQEFWTVEDGGGKGGETFGL